MIEPELLTHLAVWGAAILLIVCVGMLAFMAAVVRDTEFITQHPFLFAFETLVMSVLPAAPLLLLYYTQNVTAEVARRTFYALTFKFALFNVLLHLSGMYRALFKRDVMSVVVRPGA